MTAIDSDFGFDAVFRKSAAELKVRLQSDADSMGHPHALRTRGGVAAFSVFAGLAALSLGIVVIGYFALQSDAPEIWIHRLVALALAQSILIGAVSTKLLPMIERRRSLIQIDPVGGRSKAVSSPRDSAELRFDRVPPPLPEQPKPVVGGELAGREFLRHGDGSIEIDTLVGRRRFVSIEAAREFVGA
jgi:hypothetical protein